MPRKAKDKLVENLEVEKNIPKTRSSSKKVTTSKSRVTAKKEVTPLVREKTTKRKKSSTATKSTKTAKTTKPAKATKTAKSTKSKAAKTSKTKSTKTTRVARKKQIAKPIIEYYDLPISYEQTLVKILAQTPTILFVYWEVSEKDKQNLMKQYGENFFLETKPFLLVTNKTKNYQFETEINDYANSWYLHIPDSDCKYDVTLIRKNVRNTVMSSEYIQITSSNQLEAPNDHILFEKLGKTIFMRNVKTNETFEKDITTFAFMKKIGTIYNIYNLYKEIYKNELTGNELGVKLSSSQFSSNFS